MSDPGPIAAITVDTVSARAERVRARITDAGGDLDRVGIVAVTKGFGPDAVVAAVGAGLVEVGENYAQELVGKAAELAGDVQPRWHLIGRLQRNKVRALASLVARWDSVDRSSLGAEIAKRAPGAHVLVQVNVSEEPQKGGCPPDDVAELVGRLVDSGLQVEGLMAVGATGAPEVARPGFALLRRLADDLDLGVRSMGMSGDLEVAVEEGATEVRVGTALFGPRRSAQVV
jgi:pyridoxal phosphate enzyme (YggS family)